MFDISFKHSLLILSIIISCAGAYTYVRETFAGKTKPNRVSWLMWTIAPMIGTGAALSAGADYWVTSRIFIAGLIPTIVLVSTYSNPQSYWKLAIFDLGCGALSLLAIISWLMVDSPRLAILFAAMGDGFATLPTLVKAWRFPETETASTYLASFISTAIVIPAIPLWNIENASFQIYLLVSNTALVFAIYRKRIGL